MGSAPEGTLPVRVRFGLQKTNLKDMDIEHSNWNGYEVYGDIKELDAIVESNGFILIKMMWLKCFPPRVRTM